MSLIVHAGGREVPREYLAAVPVPAPEKRWVPIGHNIFVDSVHDELGRQGFDIERERYALSKDDARLFGTLDLTTEISEEVTLTVGIRSSLDQSFPLGFCAGNRVFVCDNLAFSAELMVRRKHTLNGLRAFRTDICSCVSQLPAFVAVERQRIERMKITGITDEAAESLILRSFEGGIVSSRLLPAVIQQWRNPDHDYGDTLWTLFNAFTYVLHDKAKSNPQSHARQTMALQALMAPKGYDAPGLGMLGD